MIKVSVLYPNNEGSKFDMNYYCNSHIPMVQEKLGKACKGVAVEQGVSGPDVGIPAGLCRDGPSPFRLGGRISIRFRPPCECHYGGHSQIYRHPTHLSDQRSQSLIV